MEKPAFAALVILLAGVALIVYFVPTIEAYRRNHRNREGVFVVNLLLGWSLVGWCVAMVWATIKQEAEPIKKKRAAADDNPFETLDDSPLGNFGAEPPKPAAPAMPVVYACPYCRYPVHVHPSVLGSAVTCGACYRPFTTSR